MRLEWNFIGRAMPFAERVQALRTDDFQLDGGALALPVKGDLMHLRISDRGDCVWFKVAGRRYDFSPSDGPVLHVDLELG